MNAYAPKDLARMLSPSISQLQTYQAPAPMQGAPVQPNMPSPVPPQGGPVGTPANILQAAQQGRQNLFSAPGKGVAQQIQQMPKTMEEYEAFLRRANMNAGRNLPPSVLPLMQQQMEEQAAQQAMAGRAIGGPRGAALQRAQGITRGRMG